MVGLKVLHDEVVGRTSFESLCDVAPPLRMSAVVYGVHDGHLLIHNEV